MTHDPWNPDQYHRFQDERSQPFFDLLALVRPRQGMRAVDLGCGTGELTARLHRALGASATLGLDSSEAMLERASPLAGDGLTFALGDLASWSPAGEPRDVIFSNAAFQWVPDHPHLLTRLAAALPPGGQLAVQMPANFDQPSHRAAEELAAEPPYVEALGGYRRVPPVLAAEEYAALLHELGFREQHVRLQVYGHVLDSREDVVEWVRGTLLTDYQRRMQPALFSLFLEAYRASLRARLPDRRPFFFPFKRLLLWGMK